MGINAKQIQVFLSRLYWAHGKTKIPVSYILINKMDIMEKKEESVFMSRTSQIWMLEKLKL